MKYNEAEEVAERIWSDERARANIARMIKSWIGKPMDPAHPFIDMAEDALVQEFDYEGEDNFYLLQRDSGQVFAALVKLIVNTIQDAR